MFWHFYVFDGSACTWTGADVIMTVHCKDCMLTTPRKWRQEEARQARQSRNAHAQMAFDDLLLDKAYQICCDILSLLFKKYTAMHVENGDAPGKFWLADDTRCVQKIHLSSEV